MARSRGRQPKRLVPRVKVWVECEGRYAFGFGLSEILSAVEHKGSIKYAADELGKSYRYVWGRIKEAEKVLGHRLVETQVGGQGLKRSALTPTARHLLASFLTLRGRVMDLLGQEFARHFTGAVSPSVGDS